MTRRLSLVLLTLATAMAGCSVLSPSPTTQSATPSASASPSASADLSSPSATELPSPTPEPPLSLPLPSGIDSRRVRVTVVPQLEADGSGELVVTVVSLAESIVPELVLRWPTDLDQTIFLAPFEPSEQRIREGGPPLLQEWTKWVVGPGESGEPAGTTSLGWGPLLGGATLTIPVLVFRNAPGPVAFDLQVLAGEAILTGEDGQPAELRIELP